MKITDIPTLHIVMFVGGMAIAIVGLILLSVNKRKQNRGEDDMDDP